MLKPVRGLERQVQINASPEAVFVYLSDLSRHGEWDAQTGFRVIRVSDEPVAAGSFCEWERIETFQAPILRGGATHTRVSWVRSLTVTGCAQNQALDFETKNIYNGLTIGAESVSFRLFPEGGGTKLVMTSRKSAHMPGPFHFIMLLADRLQGLASRLVVGWLLRTFPALRGNAQLARIKAEVERL